MRRSLLGKCSRRVYEESLFQNYCSRSWEDRRCHQCAIRSQKRLHRTPQPLLRNNDILIIYKAYRMRKMRSLLTLLPVILRIWLPLRWVTSLFLKSDGNICTSTFRPRRYWFRPNLNVSWIDVIEQKRTVIGEEGVKPPDEGWFKVSKRTRYIPDDPGNARGPWLKSNTSFYYFQVQVSKKSGQRSKAALIPKNEAAYYF